MQLADLVAGDARVAATRSRLYAVLAGLFAFPDAELHAAVADGTVSRLLAHVCLALPYDLTASATLDLARAGDGPEHFESEYIRLFDVGPAGPPCPLYGGLYGGDRMKVMEDATRFYNFFALRLAPSVRELPDHVTTELEFMHYLTFREAEVREHGEDASSLMRAERDFLERHLGRWLPRLAQRLDRQETVPFFPALARFAAAFVVADRVHAAAAAA